MLLLLTYQPPFDWAGVLAFLRARATPGVEVVDEDTYRRTYVLGGGVGEFVVRNDAAQACLHLDFGRRATFAGAVAPRLRQMFDLNCSPAPVGERLGQAALLRRAVRDNPGVRIPGTWDPFEISVRAILGQQVSVKAATTIAGRIARRFGDVVEATPPLDRLFPTPAQLVRAQLESEGVMPARAETVRRLADAVMNGVVKFDATTAEVIAALKTVRGIGDWTAQYIAMRALGDRDAFMSGDLILRRAAGHCTARELEQKSQSWRPFRSYAVMLLWRTNAGK